MPKPDPSPTTNLDLPSNPPSPPPAGPTDWLGRALELVPRFAGRASACDETDGFVSENYVDLKAGCFIAAGIPVALGGGGASYPELCQIIRTLARGCSSTALALSMHFHLVAGLVWRWRHLNAPVAEFLGRIAREQLVLVSSGGSDWLDSSGRAEAVEGGYRIQARKAFSSGCPAGDLLMTSAVFEDPEAGPTVLHFPIRLDSEHVKVVPTWRTLGMRGTGSHDLLIDGAFVPASAVSVRRPRGRWHPAMHLVAKVALPIIYSAYVGVAEAARDLALREAQARRGQALAQLLAGEMENQWFKARLAYARMVAVGADAPPGPDTTNENLMARTLVGESVIGTVEKALELVGGRSFYRNLGLERLFRDVQAARFHPMTEKPQQEIAGRLALGLDLEGA